MKTLVAIPCMDMIPVGFMRSFLMCRFGGQIEVSFSQASLVYESRNALAEKAITEGFDRVLWLDSDMSFQPDLFEKLTAHLDYGLGMVSGLYFSRKQPVKPVIYRQIKTEFQNGASVASADPYTDYPDDSVIQIDGCGFGAVFMETEYLRKVRDRYGLPFYPALGFGEDLAFCWRCRELGLPIYADTSLKLGHIGQCEFTVDAYERMR